MYFLKKGLPLYNSFKDKISPSSVYCIDNLDDCGVLIYIYIYFFYKILRLQNIYLKLINQNTITNYKFVL